MNLVEEMLYQQAEEMAGYNALALQAMAVWAWGERKSKDAMRIASFVWGRNARHLAKSVEMFPARFETNTHNSVDELLSMFSIASLNKYEAALLAEQWQSHTMAYWEVRDAVEARKQRKSKATKEKKTCPHCGGEL